MTKPAVRAAEPSDVPGMLAVRTSVRENLLTAEELTVRGITAASLAAMLEEGSLRAWCVDSESEVVGFSMARVAERDIFALFVHPAVEGRGLGSTLLDEAVRWLLTSGEEPIRLCTGEDTRAFSFYLKRGWRKIGPATDGDVMLEFRPRRAAADRSR